MALCLHSPMEVFLSARAEIIKAEETNMGLFGNDKKQKKKEVKCCRCGKKIRKYEKYAVIEREVYCERCAEAKKDWDFLEFLAIMED